MDPVAKSLLTSVIGIVCSAVFGWAVKQGFISTEQASALSDQMGTILVGALGLAGAGIVAWWKSRQHTPTALVNAVNSEAVPGVKVVRETSPSPTVIVSPAGVVQTAPPAPLPDSAKPELK